MRRERVGGLEGANMDVCDWKAIPLGDVRKEKALSGFFFSLGVCCANSMPNL